jgi:hypothetical protein
MRIISGLMAHETQFLLTDPDPDVEPFLLHLCAALAEKDRALICSARRPLSSPLALA